MFIRSRTAILTFNGCAVIPRSLECLRRRRLGAPFEVISVSTRLRHSDAVHTSVPPGGSQAGAEPKTSRHPRCNVRELINLLGDTEMNSGPTLSIGATGPDVRRLQRLLVEIKSLSFGQIDGSFGANTESAVKDFQAGNGLTVDGIVGPQTWSKLPADPGTPTLSEGATGTAVSALQKGLKSYSTQNPAADPGPIDGVFGPRTAAAVRAYQSDRGVSVDGIVGDRTWWVPAGAAGATLASLSGLTTA
jgi:murein L,D-transpeptidase YcbB/YkuD